MVNTLAFRKLRTAGLVLLLLTGSAAAGRAQSSSYEAANWPVFLLDKPEQLALPAPPAGSAAKAELQVLRKSLGTADAQQLALIKFWDAGAPAYRWNQIAPKLIGHKMDLVLRMPASWMNLAIYDATVLAWQEKVKYKRKRPQLADPSLKPVIGAPQTYSYPCEHTVTASAAAHVLAYFLPAKADSILQVAQAVGQSRVAAGVQFPSDVAAGWQLGEMVAHQIIEKAKNDGSAHVFKGEVNKDPKKWTGPYPFGIALAHYKPIVLRSPDQFRPAAPPDFEKDMEELRNFKPTFKSTAQAYYWASVSDNWMELAGQKMFENRLDQDAPAAARIYAALSVGAHETAIACMDAKYAYWGIRPSQYDPNYKPLISTPPFPGYPSGHAMGAATSAAILEYFFPADAKQFRKMAQDCADSRFYAGIHFWTDNEVGLQMGKSLGLYVVDAWMKPPTLVQNK